jgi:16S rRNA (adenine(1408)-N(1))-methyltransferase
MFVYKCAQQDPRRFFIGIDANRRPLEKISEKIHRKPAKGGLSNLLFVQAAVEDLPLELAGLASEVYVQLPWGSLLRGVVAGEEIVMRNLRRMCSPGARLEVTLGLDPDRDKGEWNRLYCRKCRLITPRQFLGRDT